VSFVAVIRVIGSELGDVVVVVPAIALEEDAWPLGSVGLEA
jgi:hypothetical protein